MSVFYLRLSAIDRLWIKGQAYRSVERLKASHVLLNEDTRTVRALIDDDLERLVLAGEIRIERHPIRPASSPPPVSQVVVAQPIAEPPRQDREHINRREVYCRRFLEMASWLKPVIPRTISSQSVRRQVSEQCGGL
jgi:hypothetical protein